jgi:hypothetical protein
MMTPERLAELEYEALQQEKRDKLNARLQVWSLLVGLVGASGVVAGVQSGAVAYAVALYPLLAACVARYAGHSESVLNQVKAYLLELEKKAGYSGYEQYNKTSGRRGVGGHMRALRDAILITDVLAVAVVAWRLAVASGYIWAGVVVLAAVPVLWITCRWLNNGRALHGKADLSTHDNNKRISCVGK